MKIDVYYTAFSLCIAVLLVVGGCVTEYQPDAKSIPRHLIVDGLITDQPGPYSVELRYTSDYSYAYLNLLATGYTLSIIDNNGEPQTMTEVSQGVYQTRDSRFQGQIGHTYQLRIVSPAGKIYESIPERLNPVAPVTRLYWQYHEQPRAGTVLKDKGFNVYLDTQDPDTTGNYYRWRWVHYEPTLICDFLSGLYRPCCSVPCWNITRCYGNKCTNVFADIAVNGKQISARYIMQAPYESRSTYYLEVEQQSLSLAAYQYWHQADQQINQTGGIFDAAPASLEGNVRCKTDPSELVFGYFGASASTKAPLVIDRSLAPSDPNIVISTVSGGDCAPCNETIYHTPIKPRWWPN